MSYEKFTNLLTPLYIGLIYYFGKYVERDIKKAIYYLNLSSNQKNDIAQYYLGLIYYNADFISRDIDKAIYYFTFSII